MFLREVSHSPVEAYFLGIQIESLYRLALGSARILIALLIPVTKIQPMFYFAKSLQAAALGVTALALLVGFREQEQAMTKELTMLGIGVVIFLIGRLIENIDRKSTRLNSSHT